MAIHWYVLQSKVHKEEVLWNRLHAKGYEVFFPCLFIHHKKTRSLRIRPFFPGYLFVRLDFDQVPISSFQWMPDTIGLVDFDEKPTWVPDHFIQAIQEHLKEVAQIGEKLLVGFGGDEKSPGRDENHDPYTAIFDSRLSGNERVIALHRLLREEENQPDGTTLAP